MNRHILVALFVLGSVVIACGDDTQTVQPQKAQQHKADDDDDVATSSTSSTTSSSGGAVIDAATGGAAVTYHATLAKTQSTQFGGGSGHCTYNVVMSDIDIELAITPEGNVIGGSAKNSMTESTVGSCTFAPLGTKPMSFSFAAPDGGTLTWAQGSTGAPKTNLTLTLTKKGAGYEGAVKWVRADRTDDLQWTVNTTVTLDPK